MLKFRPKSVQYQNSHSQLVRWLSSKNADHQVWQPEFDPQEPRGKRRELTLTLFKLPLHLECPKHKRKAISMQQEELEPSVPRFGGAR